MLKVGLTGGVACGKSTVARMLAERGAHVMDADKLAHELLRPGEKAYQEVVQRFGRGILAGDGSVDRAKLAETVFGGGRVEELNRIVHPEVIRRQEAWMEDIRQRDPHGIAVVEAALIVEAGVADRFDKLIVVTCPTEKKIERFAARQNVAGEVARGEVKRRMRAQVPDNIKAKHAGYVIDNGGSLQQLEAEVERVMGQLQEEEQLQTQ